MDGTQNKLNLVSSERLHEISENIKTLLATVKNGANFSSPIPVDLPLEPNSTSVAVPNFQFSEPLFHLNDESDIECVWNELVKHFSSLNLRECIESDTRPTQSQDDYESDNESSNSNTQSRTVPFLKIQNVESIAVRNDSNGDSLTSGRQFNNTLEQAADHSTGASYAHDDLLVPIREESPSQRENSNDRQDEVSINEEIQTSNFPLDNSIKKEFENSVASNDINENWQTLSFQMDCVKEEDGDGNFQTLSSQFDEQDATVNRNNESYQTPNAQLNRSVEHVHSLTTTECNSDERNMDDNAQEDNFQTDGGVNVTPVSIPSSSTPTEPNNVNTGQKSSDMDLNSNDRHDEVSINEEIQTSNFPLDNSIKKEFENSVASNDNCQTLSFQMDGDGNFQTLSSRFNIQYATANRDNESYQTPNAQLNCSVEHVHSLATAECNSDEQNMDDNAQVDNFQTDGRVNVTPVPIPSSSTPTEPNNVHNGQKSSDMDPNTQITNLEIDVLQRNSLHSSTRNLQPLPVLIKHLHQDIIWPNQEDCFVPELKLFDQSFNTVMVYGTVTSIDVQKERFVQRFVLDDSSGAIDVIWKANDETIELFQSTLKLNDEIKAFRQSVEMSENFRTKSTESTKYAEMLKSLKIMSIIITREVVKRTKALKRFGQVAVIGRPFRTTGKRVQLYSTSMSDDSQADRTLELLFKKHLLRLYEEK